MIEITFNMKELEELFQQITENKVSTEGSMDEDGMPIIGQQITLSMSDECLKRLRNLFPKLE